MLERLMDRLILLIVALVLLFAASTLAAAAQPVKLEPHGNAIVLRWGDVTARVTLTADGLLRVTAAVEGATIEDEPARAATVHLVSGATASSSRASRAPLGLNPKQSGCARLPRRAIWSG